MPQGGTRLGIKILTIDIETRPSLAYVWGLWDQNVGLNQVEEFGTVISWAAKWHGEKKVYFASDHHDGQEQSEQPRQARTGRMNVHRNPPRSIEAGRASHHPHQGFTTCGLGWEGRVRDAES